MSLELTPSESLELWRRVVLTSVRAHGPDLTARQLALVLMVYMTPAPHTVRGLASLLNISKPAITRALDRLGKLGIVRRKVDESDRRSILVQRTVKGSVFLREFADLVAQTGRELRAGEAKPGIKDAAAS
jgi:DNA-binding MarR family transcriptional regulator